MELQPIAINYNSLAITIKGHHNIHSFCQLSKEAQQSLKNKEGHYEFKIIKTILSHARWIYDFKEKETYLHINKKYKGCLGAFPVTIVQLKWIEKEVN